MNKYNKQVCDAIKKVATVIDGKVVGGRSRAKVLKDLAKAEKAAAKARRDKSQPWRSCRVGKR